MDLVHEYDYNSFSAYGSAGYTRSDTRSYRPFDLPLHRQIRSLQFSAIRERLQHQIWEGDWKKRDDWNQPPDSWIHAPPDSFYPPLPDGYNYSKDFSKTLKGRRDQKLRPDGVYQVQWPRSGIHDLYAMSLWTLDGLQENMLIIQETEMKDKVEEWRSIGAAMGEKTTYIVCEPPQIGWRLRRYNIVENYVHRMVIKSCVWTVGLSFIWPHKTFWYWPPFLLATTGILIYRNIRKDPSSNYQVVKDPYFISRFPLYLLGTGQATILRFHSHDKRWWWQRVIFALTSLRVLYKIIFPSPPCICDWRAVEAITSHLRQ